MNNPKVSIVIPAYRPGGFDITFSGLAAQTFKNFEVIIVDNRYEKRGEMPMMAASYGLNIIHVPEHRRNGKWIASAAAFNTGFALARGKYVITLMDYSFVVPTFVATLVEEFREAEALGKECLFTVPYTSMKLPQIEGINCDKTIISRIHERLEPEIPPAHLDELALFKNGPFDGSWVPACSPSELVCEGDTEVWDDRRPRGGDKFHVSVDETYICMRVEAISLNLLWRLNGVDERYNRGRGAFDHDFALRVLNAGGEIIWMPNMPPVLYFNPHLIMGSMPFGDTRKRVLDRWDNKDCYTYLEKQRQRKAIRANNPFHIEKLAANLEPWRNPQNVCVPWDVPDTAYWRREIWPETPPEGSCT